VLGRQLSCPTRWLTERHGYDPTFRWINGHILYPYTYEYNYHNIARNKNRQVGGQAVLGRQLPSPTPWLTERHGYDPTLYHGNNKEDKMKKIIGLE
ncbi:hypothetical protein, partial [Enterobacter asburiae]